MKFRIILVLLALVAPTVVNALGLGKLELQSALNQPFKARVELLSVTADELDSLKVSLAAQDAFDRAGIQRTFLLTQLRFRVQETDKGSDYIRIYSNDPIREPFLNFLLEINWSKGRLFREYTVLLDPPTYIVPGSKKKAAIHPVTPIMKIDSDDHQVVYDLDYKSESKTRVSPRAPATPSYEPQSSYTAPPTINYAGSGDYGPAVTGDTLWSIAKAARPDSSVSIQQMMLAIINANPDAFIENNINGLKRGAILEIPDATEVGSLNQSDALAQVISQHALWDEYKGHVASSVSQQAEGAAAYTGVSDEPLDVEQEPSVTDVDDAGEAELRLISESDQDSGSDQGTAGESGVDVDALNNELALANESIEALFMENAELKDKLTETEGIIDDLKRLIVLKEDELAAMQEQIMIASAAQEDEEFMADEELVEEELVEEELVEEELVEEELVEEEAVEEDVVDEEMEAEAAEEEIVMDITPAGGGVFDEVLGMVMGLFEKAKANLIIIAKPIGILLILVFLVLFVSKRRGKKAAVAESPTEDFPDFGEKLDSESVTVIPDSEDETIVPGDEAAEEDSAGESSGEEEKTVVMGSDTADVDPDDAFEVPETKVDVSQESASEIPAEDPMEEINAFLAYEHFDEAESLVRNSLEKEPDNLDFHDTLLEVFYSAGNKKSYEDAARIVHEKTGGEGEYWDRATARWQELSPNRALFDTPAAGEDEIDTPDTTGGGVLNIAEDGDGNDASGMDFDIGGDESEDDSANEEKTVVMGSDTADAELELDLAAGESEELLDNALEMSSGDVEKIQQAEAGAAEEILDITGAIDLEDKLGESSEEVTLDVSSSGESSESDGLDLSLDEGSLDVDSGDTSGEGEEELLDISVAEDSEDSNELDISFEDASGDDSSDVDTPVSSDELDISLGDSDISGEGEEDLLDFSIAEDSEDLLDVTSAINIESEGEEDLLDFSITKNSENSNELDMSLDNEAGEKEDLLDVTSAISFESEGEADLLDVTTSSSAGADAEKGTDTSGGIELDDGIIDMESTVEMPPASVEALSMTDDDDEEEDHTLVVPKSSDVDEQSEDEEMASQLDLAKAYIELGDNENAKTILNEIMAQGNETYRKQAEELIGQIK